MTISVLIADDHLLIREGLVKILSQDEAIVISGLARDGCEAVKMTMKNHPQVVLMDVNMPNMNGIEATRVIKSELPQVGVIALSVHDGKKYVEGMIEAGVSAYLLKDVEAETLLAVIKEVASGTSHFAKGVAKKDILKNLTKREMDVLKLTGQGMSNKDIAEILFISEKTVKNHLTNIFKKINVADRTQAALYAIKRGLVKL